MSISAEDVQEMQAEIERLKNENKKLRIDMHTLIMTCADELADLKMHYRQAVKHEKLLEDELVVTRRALGLACAEIIYWCEREGGICPKYTNSLDCSVEMKDRTLEGCRACGKEYLSQLFIQQAREES